MKTPFALSVALLMCAAALPAPAQETTANPAPQSAAAEDWAALRIQARDMREKAKAMRGEAEATFKTANAACWQKFLVSSCQEDARRRKRDQEQDAKRIDVEAGRLERRIKAHDLEEKAAQRAAEAPQRAAEAAKRGEEIRRQEEAALQRQAEHQAEIEKRQRGAR